MPFKKILSLLLCASALVSLGAGCSSAPTAVNTKPVTLKIWRTFDSQDNFQAIFDAYHVLHPQVSFEYKKLRPEEYESELIKALAKGEGPDIFSVHNTKMGEYLDYLMPMPTAVTVGTLTTQGTLRKETVTIDTTDTLPTANSLKKDYVDAVAKDMFWPYRKTPTTDPVDRIYGLPLSLDTLALFYNKDLLNASGIAQPPTTWDDFLKDTVALTKYAKGSLTITQSGAALGTAHNVDRAVDIVQLLMLQNGTVMVDSTNNIAFNAIPKGVETGVYPGLDAVSFYTDFANTGKESYSWNDTMPTAFEAFSRGTAAFFLGYSYDTDLLKAAAPKLRFGISKAPQIAGGRQVNFANYWLEGVSKSTQNANYAWDFLAFAASKDHVASYLASAHKPTALRSLIASQLDDPEIGPFTEQVLTATSWYRGKHSDAMETAFEALITDILKGTGKPADALTRAARLVAQSY